MTSNIPDQSESGPHIGIAAQLHPLQPKNPLSQNQTGGPESPDIGNTGLIQSLIELSPPDGAIAIPGDAGKLSQANQSAQALFSCTISIDHNCPEKPP